MRVKRIKRYKNQKGISSQKEEDILYINTCVWNLERWVLMSLFLQDNSGDTNRENRLGTQWGKDRVGGTERIV